MATKTIEQLAHQGVTLHAPEGIHIDNDIRSDRISGNNVTIHAGCRLFGEKTLICEGVELGSQGPVTLKNCYVGPNVKLKGGYFESAVFLAEAEAGSGSHVRGGTILEEKASIAHTVGLKQTILFPFVTLGSLINFCDCLMAGGTSRQNHSEVGSSYIHFNFTPNQDKATPSLMGDVPRGVMLNQSPIFLGGQGGLVGPCRLAYGTVVAAGTICRKDQLEENYLVMEGGPRSARLPFNPGGYRNLRRILAHNYNYIANLTALSRWYAHIRNLFIGPDFPQPLADGLSATLDKGIAERIAQLGKLRNKMANDGAKENCRERAFYHAWPQIEERLLRLKECDGERNSRDQFIRYIEQGIQKHGKDYLRVIQDLRADHAAIGSQWLQGIVDTITGSVDHECR